MIDASNNDEESTILAAVEEDDQPPIESMSASIRSIVEWISVIVAALAAALLIRAYAVQAFEIPSGSMEPTVNVGDRILVNKLSYRFGEVERGNLVVFEKLPGTSGSTEDLIKRAIALPGETIEVRPDGRIWITGTDGVARQLDEPYLEPSDRSLAPPDQGTSPADDIWDDGCVNAPREPARCVLDDQSYFMMGDNRDGSSDSRSFGPVPEENLVGKAFAKVWPLDALGGL